MFTHKLLIAALCLLSPIIMNSQNKAYKAGEIYTENIYQYGKMEVRMLAATGSGIISNFFTFKEGSELSSTFWEEIDIEVFGKDGANSWQSNLITGQGNTNLTRTEGVHQENDLGEEYHTYTVEWTPNSVTWLIDGIIVRQINGGQSLLIGDETSLRFNIWNPNIPEWVGAFNENILPVHMYVNWIKFYEWNGSSFSDNPTFEDNFNSLDDNTWTKANHTFAENMSDFISENVNTVNGYLVLSITKADETGYNGTPPTDNDNDDDDDDDNTTTIDGDNLALNGTASQSSTGFNGVASRAIDGNTIGVWSNGSVTHTNPVTDSWWQVDLERQTNIDNIVIYNRTDSCCLNRLSNFTVTVTNNNGNIVFSQTITQTPNTLITIDAGNITGNTIRITTNLANTALSLAEVEVYGEVSDENNNNPDGDDDNTEVSTNCNNIQNWSASTTYSQEGTQVLYNSNIYENKWYTENQNPEAFSTNSWDLWTLIGSCDSAAKSLSNDLFDVTSFPNPFTNTINVISDDIDQAVGNIKLVDMSGKTIAKSTTNGSSQTTISNINVTKGIYLLQVFNTKNQLIKVVKMIKE